jgi:hypothetical protein
MADIFTITVPELVIIITEDQKMDFAGFIRWTLATHASYNHDAAGIRAAVRLERKFEYIIGTEPTKSFDLDAEDLQRLRVAVENPLGGYPIRPAHKMLPFVEAVVDAKQKE